MPQVESSAIRSIHYSDRRRELSITFAETGTYIYREVPQQVYDDFVKAPSKGQFFNEAIRDRYPFDRGPGRDWAVHSR